MNLKIKRLTETAKLPIKKNPTDAGVDIFTDEEVTIHAGETVAISTGVAIELPTGTYGRLKARSGLTLQTPLRVLEGTIDFEYRGEIKVLAEIKGFEFNANESIFNRTLVSNPYTVPKGTKIAQLIIQPLPNITIVETEELSDTCRGNNGFGSSGV